MNILVFFIGGLHILWLYNAPVGGALVVEEDDGLISRTLLYKIHMNTGQRPCYLIISAHFFLLSLSYICCLYYLFVMFEFLRVLFLIITFSP